MFQVLLPIHPPLGNFQSSPTTKGSGGLQIWAGSSGEQQWTWMLIEVGFSSEKEGKWQQESWAVDGGRVWVTLIGPKQCRDVEAGRWFNGRQRWVLQCIGYGSCNTLIFREKNKTCQANAFHLNSDRKFLNNLIGCILWHAYFLALGRFCFSKRFKFHFKIFSY
jgi:hypothetical protein